MDRFPKNARVCFIGDSITCNNRHVARVAAYYHEHFPDDNINFYNCGASGANSDGTLALMECDTLTYKPTHAVLMFGVNDSGRSELVRGRSTELYNELKQRLLHYKENLHRICGMLEATGVDITLATPVPLDEYSSFDTPTLSGAFALMSAYAEHVRAYAKEHGYPLIDQFAEFTRLLMSGERIYESDRVHPNEYGQYCLARNILEAQGLTAPDYAPIPEFMGRWVKLVEEYRYYVITVECLLIGRYDLPDGEAIEIVKKKLETEQNEFVLEIGKKYLETKPNAMRIKAEMTDEMEHGLKHRG